MSQDTNIKPACMKVSRSMYFVAASIIALSSVNITSAWVHKNYSQILGHVIQLTIGIITLLTAKSFQNASEEEGGEPIEALTKLKKLYSLKFWLYTTLLILTIIGLLAVSAIKSARGF